MAKWYRSISNFLFVVAATTGLAGVFCATGWLDWPGPGLSASPEVMDVGDVAPGDTVPLVIRLHNGTRTAVRLVGASEP